MEHKKKELREARQLGIEQAENIDWFGGRRRAFRFDASVYGDDDKLTVEDAIDNNPYTDPVLSRNYWQGYLDEVEKNGSLDDLFREVRELAGEYFDSGDTIERLGYLIPFPFGSKLHKAFLDGYFYFTEAARESRFDVMDEIGEDWQPSEGLIDAFFKDETDWRNSFFEKMSSSKRTRLPPRLYKFRRLGTKEDVSRIINDLILGNELWFSKVSQLNDLFEFKLTVKNALPAPDEVETVNFWDVTAYQLNRVWASKAVSSELREEMRDIIMESRRVEQGFKKAWKVVANRVETRLTEIRDELGVCCFAGNVENRLLWTHYAGENQGVALGFSPTSPFWSGLRRVHYQKRPPVCSNASDHLDDAMAKALITKHEDWAYEDEWRLIGQPSDKSSRPGMSGTPPASRHIYPKNDLAEVVFGLHTTDENKQTIYEACATTGLRPQFFEVRRATGYDLEIRECNIQLKNRTSRLT